MLNWVQEIVRDFIKQPDWDHTTAIKETLQSDDLHTMEMILDYVENAELREAYEELKKLEELWDMTVEEMLLNYKGTEMVSDA